jgi:hypothetical protein
MPDVINFPGLQSFIPSMTVAIRAGDKYSNPVQAGTAVYFNSTNGVISTAAALTNNDGVTSKTLFSANPLPLGSYIPSGLTSGFSRVHSRTLGENSALVTDSSVILWTGKPIITKTSGVDTLAVPDGGSAGPWSFTVKDYLDHPMSKGTVVTVEGNALTINGDANVTIADTQVGGSGVTTFNITVKDINPGDTDPPAASILMVKVIHPVYGTFTKILATGTVN